MSGMSKYRMASYISAATVGGVAASYALLKKTRPWVLDDLRMGLKWMKLSKEIDFEEWRMGKAISEHARTKPDKDFIRYPGGALSFKDVDLLSNQMAHLLIAQGVGQGDIIAVCMRNDPVMVITCLAINKLGAVMALINYNLRREQLCHCLKVANAKTVIVTPELLPAVQPLLTEIGNIPLLVPSRGGLLVPGGHASIVNVLEGCNVSSEPIPDSYISNHNKKAPAAYIYTSGTTGRPKAATITHNKTAMVGALLAYFGPLADDDVVYITLPLYHTSAFGLGLMGCLLKGHTMALAPKFSASSFWSDCVRYKATVFLYIGEFCRYLLATPPGPYDRSHSIKSCFGNGLRKDIWLEFMDRFNIPVVREFYGATEANIGAVNNNGAVGAVGALSPATMKGRGAHLVRYDQEDERVIRNSEGWCEEVPLGDKGLLIAEITENAPFHGYKDSDRETEKKVLRNVFKEGDAYLSTGDMLYLDNMYNLYFADRLGDTFRWKGENVSTIEVANIISTLPGVADACVYGVAIPGKDGKAGMVAIQLDADADGSGRGVVDGASVARHHDGATPDVASHHEILAPPSDEFLRVLYEHTGSHLASYAQPVLVRFVPDIPKTVTFKHMKYALQKDGYDVGQVKHVYVRSAQSRTYVPLTAGGLELMTKIQSRL